MLDKLGGRERRLLCDTSSVSRDDNVDDMSEGRLGRLLLLTVKERRDFKVERVGKFERLFEDRFSVRNFGKWDNEGPTSWMFLQDRSRE
jgi:hypothetical protein